MPRVNYVIATWTGDRVISKLDKDAYYIPGHINQLNQLNKKLNQITIGYPLNEDLKDYSNYLLNLREIKDGTPVRTIQMENKGWSYGQLSRIYGRMRELAVDRPVYNFDYYIFMEDDYVPVLHNFDKILVDMMEADPECGYICSVNGNEKEHPNGAAVATGIIRAKALEDIWQKFGCLSDDGFASSHGGDNQVAFSQTFIKTGWKIKDYLDEYASMFIAKAGEEDEIWIYGKNITKFLFAPIQLLDERALKLRMKFFEMDDKGQLVLVKETPPKE